MPTVRKLVLVWVATIAAARPLTAAPPVVQTQRALDHLGQAALAWQAQFNCSGCHKQPMTLAALATGVSRGHDAPLPGVVPGLVAGTVQGTSGQNAAGCFSFGGSSGFTMATTFAGRGLEASDRFLNLDFRTRLQSAADCLLARQAADGRLPADSVELPVSQGDFVTTAHGAYVWKRAFERTGAAAYHDAADRAIVWLRGRIAAIEAAPASFTTQDQAMLLAGLGGLGAGTADPDVARMHAVLASAQGGDGSWKIDGSTAGGNAHATGQAVFALRAAGFESDDPVLAAGRDWLLAHEQADGSWPAVNWTGGTPSAVAPSMWGALALATFPSPLATLRAAGTTIGWANVEGAESYDLIRGSLSALQIAGGNVDLADVTCLAAATSAISVDDPQLPAAPGDGFFYVFRLRWGSELGGYGRSSGGQERLPATGDCGP
ncbi:MAG TPA: hypothetical protein VJS92_03100 [Candidatus Polarisedimenticolaceae bacterium]|nr:hypothetical protein [Candidatus Polarisedimenticolaceae bacterium]